MLARDALAILLARITALHGAAEEGHSRCPHTPTLRKSNSHIIGASHPLLKTFPDHTPMLAKDAILAMLAQITALRGAQAGHRSRCPQTLTGRKSEFHIGRHPMLLESGPDHTLETGPKMARETVETLGGSMQRRAV